MKKILIFFTIYFLMIFDSFGVETKADSAFVLDFNSNTVLFEKNSDEKQGPASMSKLMIIYMVLERLQNGTLNLDEEFLVSRKAWKYGGSKMFVNVGDNVSVKDLLRGVIVQSGNDACIVLAEGLSGTEEDMVIEMNKNDLELVLTNNNFIKSKIDKIV